jgi:hypothetical protein
MARKMAAAISPKRRIIKNISVDGLWLPCLRLARSRRFSSVSLSFWKSRGAGLLGLLWGLVMVVHRSVPIWDVPALVPIWNVRLRFVECNRVDSVAGL